MKNNLLGIILPTNNPDIMYKYILSSLDNLLPAKDYAEFLINFQPTWSPESIEKCVEFITNKGFKVVYGFNKYEVKGPGLVPVNKFREDTAKLDPTCEYYMIFDDDMTFLGPSPKMPRCAGEQILEALIYLKTFKECGVLVFGGSLIKKIERDSISSIHKDREYVTGKGLIVKRISDTNYLLPEGAYGLVGSDEEKVAAGWRIANGYFVAEMPFVRINHYENQLSSRNKNGKVPGKDSCHWNTDEIKNANNFKFIRDNWNPDYTSGKGNIVSDELYDKVKKTSEVYTLSFKETSTEELIKLLGGLV